MANNNILRIDFEVGYGDGGIVHGTEHSVTVLYNQTVISTEEVKDLIINQKYDCDLRIIVTTPIQANALAGRYPCTMTAEEVAKMREEEKK